MTIKTYTASCFALLALCAGAMAQTQQADTIPYGRQRVTGALLTEQERNSNVGSQVSVDAEQISTWKSTSLSDAIRGKLAGYIKGAVRGTNTPNISKPLVVLDGTPMQFYDISYLDPTVVEEVTVMKDAAAKCLYGPQGANGVVIIKTKMARDKQTRVNFSANFGFLHRQNTPDHLSAFEQATLRNQALTNDGLLPKFSATQLQDFANGTGIDNDWRKLYLCDRFFQKYNVEVMAGSERVHFYINAGFQHENGDYKVDQTDKFDPSQHITRFTLVSNLDAQLYPYLRGFVHTNVGVRRINSTRAGNSGIEELVATTPAYVPDGMTADGRILTAEGFGTPIYGAINYTGLNTLTETDLLANMGLDLDMSFLTPGLHLRGIFGYSSNYCGIRGGFYDYGRSVLDKDGNPVNYMANIHQPLSFGKGTTTNYYIDFQAMLGYQRKFGRSDVSASVNYLAEDYRGPWTNLQWILPSSRVQLSGEAKYGYADRYFLQFDFNYAGSETMAKGRRFHFSPTVGAAWVVSNESFLKDNDVLTYLKLRASYGRLYLDALCAMDSRYLYENEYRESTGSIGGIYKGFLITEGRRGNPEISWEKSSQQNYGVDLGIGRHLRLTADYWRTNTSDILVQSQLTPTVGGISSSMQPWENSGKVTNQGFDISATYSTKLGCGLGIEATGQVGWNRNKYTYAAELDYSSAGYAYPYRRTGYTIGEVFGYEVDTAGGSPYYNSQAEIDNSGLRYAGVQPRPGDFKYKDLNGDGIIDEGDKAPMGIRTGSPGLEYGATVRLDYHGFDLYLDFLGYGGRCKMMNTSCGVCETVGAEGTYQAIHQKAWTAERYAAGEEIEYPALTSSRSSSLTENSFFRTRADYLRLHNITLGYSLPESFVKRIGLKKLRVYVDGQDLLTFDNYKFDGLDPEATHIYNPLFRSVNIGLDINF